MTPTPCPHCGAPLRRYRRDEAPTSTEWAAFIAAWRQRHGEKPTPVAVLHVLAIEYGVALSNRVQLGHHLSASGATRTHASNGRKEPAKWTPPPRS